MKDQFNEKLLKKLIPDKSSRDLLMGILDTLPGVIAILDEERRLVYANSSLADLIPAKEMKTALNLRPGEIFSCVNARKNTEGCGADEACEFCGAFRALESSRAEMTKKSSHYRIWSETDNKNQFYNFRITSTPLESKAGFFYIISLEDITSEQRKQELERIFYHDLMNTVGSLSGVINLIKSKNETDPVYTDILESTYNTMFDSINEQKQLSGAESGKLKLQKDHFHAGDLLIETTQVFSSNPVYRTKLEIDGELPDLMLQTDYSMLSRILTNMIKNAMEASGDEDVVKVRARKNGTFIRFSVWNPGHIPEEVRFRLFGRSYSTKGNGRGLGTYSMKLLGENYLGGKVDYTSDVKKGTEFWFDLPMNP